MEPSNIVLHGSPDSTAQISYNSSTDLFSPPSLIATGNAGSHNNTTATTKINNGTPLKFSQWTTDWITDWWGMELLCWTFSAISLAAIVLILESHKNQPLPEWPFKLTLNSIISILATSSQMAMMKPVVECISQLKWLWFVRGKEKLADFHAFDDASRGPTGSLILLGKLRGLHLITLGVIISIFSVAFSAFSQQVVIYPLHLHGTGNASTPLVLNFTEINDPTFQLDGSVIASMFNGLSANGSSLSDINSFCSTGNCTWNTYPSLGVCTTVTDISSMIFKNVCNQSTLDKFFQEVGFENPGYPCFNYTLPFVSTSDFLLVEGEVSSATNITLSNVVPLQGEGMQFLTLTPILDTVKSRLGTSFVGAYLMYQPGVKESINSSLANPIAYGLNFELCVQTYNTTVLNGVTTTVLTSTQPFYLNVTEELVLGDGKGSGFDVKGSNLTTVSVGGMNFSVSLAVFEAITGTSVGFVSDRCFSRPSEAVNVLGTYFCASIDSIAQSFLNSPNSLDPLSLMENITNNVATSMTNAFRSGAGGQTQIMEFPGVAFSLLPYVGTDYTWLIFPITLVSLTLVFLLATISKSQRLGSRVWKSSNIATLQGLHIDLHNSLGGLTSISAMDEKAKIVKVRFDMEGGKAEHGLEYRLVESKQKEDWTG